MNLKTIVDMPALVISMPLIAFQPCQADSQPIIDIRFDAPYQQIASSDGDEWAPTWGRNDVLYTGSDDGTNFGGIPGSAVSFGELVGTDPHDLKGTTVNAMKEYREGEIWQAINTYTLDRVLYRFTPCESGVSCLTRSTGSSTRVFSSREFSVPSFISLPEVTGTDYFGAKVGGYVYAIAQAGVINGEQQYFVARVRKSKLPESTENDWAFIDKNGSWTKDPDAAVPMPNARIVDHEGISWKITNSYSVGGTVYMFIARMQEYEYSKDPAGRMIFRDSSIIKSTDNGKTWVRRAQDNRDKPMFPGQRFGAPYFVWYGKDGSARVDNAKQYIYAVSNNGYWDSGDDYVLGRVPRTKLAALSASDWSFYTSGDGLTDTSWTGRLSDAGPILRNPGQAGMTGMTYIEGLHRYVMIGWHYPSHGWRDVQKNQDAGTVLEFFEAPKPWGPWSRVKTFKADGLGWYTPIVGQRFQAVASSTTVTAFFYAAGMIIKSDGSVDMTRYKMNYMPITVSTEPLKHQDPNFIGATRQ